MWVRIYCPVVGTPGDWQQAIRLILNELKVIALAPVRGRPLEQVLHAAPNPVYYRDIRRQNIIKKVDDGCSGRDAYSSVWCVRKTDARKSSS
jgi:hypothetical protein